ncbi:hypothetical protein CMO93_02785 [Candidatus Woesearchaeota archaeon]|nr:hypothetical protein [Candidatus Woesearchaeota archaeon]
MKKTILMQFIALFLLELTILYPVNFVYALGISNVDVTDITSNSARIKWFTDEVADGNVRYGPDQNLGFSSRHSTYIFEHNQLIQGMDSEATYFFEIESSNINGQYVVDNNNGQFYSFTTKDNTPPEKVTGIDIVSITRNSITISWQQSDASDLGHYSIYRDNINILNTTDTTFTGNNLEPGTTYSYKVSAVDTSENEGQYSNEITITTEALDLLEPVISNVKVIDIKEDGATITWSTNEDSASIVHYYTETSDKEKKSVGLVKNHSISLANLEKATYSFVVTSCDEDNNCIDSSVSTFKVGIDINPPKIDTQIPKFFNKKQIDITGTTKPLSTIKLFVNDMNFPVRALDSSETSEGTFRFFNIQLQKENVIKLLAIDKAGNKNESTFRISVDTEKPIVVLNPIPGATSKKNLTVVGTVDELVFINFFLRLGADTKLEKIIGLKAVAKNDSIKLEWNETTEEDFSHYIIYRKDVGPIAITQSISYNAYTDLLVNKGREYVYWVSAVNKFGRESDKSEPAAAKTANGRTDIPKPQPIDKLIIVKPTTTINTSASFSQSLKLSRDGKYVLVIEILDRAKNRVVIEKTIRLDTKKPNIKITSPPSNQLIFENYANEIDIKGITDPNAKVHLFIDRTPFGALDKSFSITAMSDKLTSIQETDLDAKCSLKLGGSQFCKTGADFSTTADSSGNFEFEDVDLTSTISGGMKIPQIPASEMDRRQGFKDERKARLIFIATDEVGLRNAKEHKLQIGTCWSGNQSWDVIPLTEYQSPALISPQRLAENKEIINFFINYSYIGRGEDGKVTGMSISRACSGKELLGDKRFNISCQIMPSSGTTIVNDDGTVSYTSIQLNRAEGMDRFLQNDWKNFFNSVSNELTFPMKFVIQYTHDVDGKEVKEVQRTCHEVTYVLDNSLIDPRKVLPDWVLYDLVDFLRDSVETINKVNTQVTKVLEYAAFGCVSSFMIRFAIQIHRRFITFFEENTFAAKKLTGIDINDLNLDFKPKNSEDKDYCNKVALSIAKKGISSEATGEELKELILGSLGEINLKDFSDKDLERCFPNVADAWEREADMYGYYRFTCDRVFGHKTPSAWTEGLEDKKIFNRVLEGQTCATDENVRGQPLRAVKCRTIAKEEYEIKPDRYGLEDTCLEVQEQPGKERVLYKLGGPVGVNDLYNVRYTAGNSKKTVGYVIKQTETQYLTYQPKTCREVCGLEGKDLTYYGNKKKSVKSSKKEWWSCIPKNNCVNLPKTKGGKEDISKATPSGYTQDCFYKADKAPSDVRNALRSESVVSNDPKSRYECCCINVEDEPPSIYYDWEDINPYKNPEAEEGKKDCAFQSKGKSEECPKKDADTKTGFADMKWSYRYWKEGYTTKSKAEEGKETAVHTKYNPYRYIEGRDFTACFGQDNWFYDANVPKGETGDLVTIDSRQEHIAAFQCANIGGIQQRLVMINNFQSALGRCLIDIRETGTSDALACREIFTRYVCSSIWQVISAFSNSCSPFSLGMSREEDFFGTVGGGFKSVFQSVADTQSELTEEYGNAELNNLIGASTGEVARKLCLAAFGYDWDLTLQNVIDAAYSQTFASVVQATTGTREYLTIDPTNNKARYDYSASWIINPGCDLEKYTVDLSCVTRNELEREGEFIDPLSSVGLATKGIRCDAVNSPDGSNCDCLNSKLTQEQTARLFNSRGKIKQNQFIQGSENKIIPSFYRYDHLKIKLTPDRKLRGDSRKTCFPPGHEDGIFYFPLRDKSVRDITGCHANVESGEFECSGGLSFFNTKGIANMLDIEINDKKPEKKKVSVFIGKPLKLKVDVRKSQDSGLKCLVVSVDKEKKGESKVDKPKVIRIDFDGKYTYEKEIIDKLEFARSKSKPEIEPYGCGDSRINENKIKDKDCKELIENLKLEHEFITENDEWGYSTTLKFINADGINGIDLGENSVDKIKIGGEQIKLIGSLTFEGGEPVVELLNKKIKFKIENVGFNDKLEEIEYRVTLPRKGGSENWNLWLSLYEANEGSNNCKTYEKSKVIEYQGREQKEKIILQVRTEAEEIMPPEIDFKFDDKRYLNPENDEIGLTVTVAAQGENKEGKDKKLNQIQYWLVPPQGQGKELDKYNKDCKANDKKEIKCTITINNKLFDDIKLTDYQAGEYKINIEAHDDMGQRTEKEEEFTVRCGPGDGQQFNRVGKCEATSTCDRSIRINPQTVSCPEEKGLVCCGYWE